MIFIAVVAVNFYYSNQQYMYMYIEIANINHTRLTLSFIFYHKIDIKVPHAHNVYKQLWHHDWWNKWFYVNRFIINSMKTLLTFHITLASNHSHKEVFYSVSSSFTIVHPIAEQRATGRRLHNLDGRACWS